MTAAASSRVPAATRGPLAVTAVHAAATLLVGLLRPAVDAFYVALIWLGATVALPFGLVFGLATVPAFHATGVGYAPPELTPDPAAGFVSQAWRYHVGAGTYYALLAGALGPYFAAVLAGGVVGPARALPAVGGLGVGAAFLASQLWRTRVAGRSASRRTVLLWAVYGALLAVPPLFVVTAWDVLWGAGTAG